MRSLAADLELADEISDWPLWEILAADDDDDEELIPIADMIPGSDDLLYRIKCIRTARTINADPRDLYRNERISEVYLWDALKIADDYRSRSREGQGDG